MSARKTVSKWGGVPLSFLLAFSLTPATAYAESAWSSEFGSASTDALSGPAATSSKEEAKLVPGSVYTFTDGSGEHSQKISSVFDFVEGNIAYKIIGEDRVEVADWSWRWSCGSDGHSGFVSSEYGNRGTLTIPGTVRYGEKDYRVVGVGKGAFCNVSGTDVVLPDGIEYLGIEAFANYDGVSESLTIPSSVTEISASCFYGCKLSGISFSGSSQLKTVGDKAFDRCTQIEELVLPEGVESLGERVFQSNTGEGGISKVTIPGSVMNLTGATLEGFKGGFDGVTFTPGTANFIKQDGVIYGYGKLLKVMDASVQTIEVPEGVVELGPRAFAGCNSLTSVDLPESLEVIGSEAFRDRVNLTSITGGENVVSIGEMSFMNCTSLTKVELPSLEAIPVRAFDSCTSLETAICPNIKSLGLEAFDGCSSLKEAIIPEGVTEIPEMAFCGCTSLERIVLPEGLTSIGDYAFDLTVEDSSGNFVNPSPRLQSINIPSTVTSLGDNFLGGVMPEGQTKLVSAVKDPESVFTEDALAGVSESSGGCNLTVYYPADLKDVYENSGLVGGEDSQDQGGALNLSLEDFSLAVGASKDLGIAVPDGFALEVASDNPSVAEVSGGQTVVGKSAGSADVTASLKLGGVVVLQDSCSVTVVSSGGGGGVVAPEYEVSIGEFPNGKVSADVASADEGETVTLSAVAEPGFELAFVSVVGPDGQEVELEANADGTYSFDMPAFDVEVKAAFECDGGELCPSHAFSDVDCEQWYHAAIDWAVDNGVLHGIGDTGLMAPDGVLTRAQMATILWNLDGNEAVAYDGSFSDVAEGDWFSGAVSWAVSEGVFFGYEGAGQFGPNDELTREQAAVVLMRWSALRGEDVSVRADLFAFPDAASVSEWASEAMSWAVAEGVLSGVEVEPGVRELQPLGTATRAQAAALMMNLSGK